MASIRAGASGQVTTRARTRRAGCMWPSWQHPAPPHSGSALIRGPVAARSCPAAPARRLEAQHRQPTKEQTMTLTHAPAAPGHVAPSPMATKVAALAAALLGSLALHDRGGHRRAARPVRPGAAHLVAGLREPLGWRDVGHVGRAGRGLDPGGHEPPPAPRRGHPVPAVAVVRPLDGRRRHRGLAGHGRSPRHHRTPRRHDERAAARRRRAALLDRVELHPARAVGHGRARALHPRGLGRRPAHRSVRSLARVRRCGMLSGDARRRGGPARRVHDAPRDPVGAVHGRGDLAAAGQRRLTSSRHGADPLSPRRPPGSLGLPLAGTGSPTVLLETGRTTRCGPSTAGGWC